MIKKNIHITEEWLEDILNGYLDSWLGDSVDWESDDFPENGIKLTVFTTGHNDVLEELEDDF